jgi:Mg2+/Co2+ transporter CorC
LKVQIISLRDSICVERAELEELVKGLRAEQIKTLAEKDVVEGQLKTALEKIQQISEAPNRDPITTRSKCVECTHRELAILSPLKKTMILSTGSNVTVKSEPRVKIETEDNLGPVLIV